MNIDGVSRREAILRIGLTTAATWTGVMAATPPHAEEASDLPLDDALRALHREEPRGGEPPHPA